MDENQTIKTEFTEEDIANAHNDNTTIVQDLKNDGNDVISKFQNAKELADKGDYLSYKKGVGIAQESIKDLAKLILYQEIVEGRLSQVFDIVDRTKDGFIKNGNAKEYIAKLTTGTSTYLPEKFIPDAQTKKYVEKYFLQVYDDKDTLNPKAYQFMKEMTLNQREWLPYFLSGTLSEFMNYLREELYKCYKVYMFQKFCTLITTLEPVNAECKMTGTATNMFDALVKDVIPVFEKMTQYNSQYMQGESKQVLSSKASDILIIMSTKNASQLKNGILTQLFNANMLGPDGKSLKRENLCVLGNIITIGDSNSIITDTKTEWVDDNTIYLVDISYIKSVMQIEDTEVQHFARNMTTYLVNHIWGVMDILPWCKFFKYTNPNLSTLPAEEVDARAYATEKEIAKVVKKLDEEHKLEVERAKKLKQEKK